MKKVLLILFVLAICMLAFPQGVLADNAPRAVTIDAVYGTPTDFNAVRNPAFTSWTLTAAASPNEVNDAIMFTLKTQSPTWSVTAASDNSGFMHGDQGVNLNSPFYMYADDVPGFVIPTGNALIKEGGPSNSNQDWNAAIRQPLLTTDPGSSIPWFITITFTCAAGF
jgi:hypothetical protein